MGNRNEIVLRIKKMNDVKTIRNTKLKIPQNTYTLDLTIAFLFKDSTLKTRKVLNHFHRFYNAIDLDMHEGRNDILSRLWVIRKTLDLIINERIFEYNSLKSELINDDEIDELKISIIGNIDSLKIGYEDSKKLIKRIDDGINFGYVLTIKDLISDLAMCIDEDDYKTYREVSEDLY